MAWELPVRRGVIEERIGKSLSRFMREGRYILEPAPKRPGEIQLAYCVTQRGCGVVEESRKKVWKPSTQQPPGVFGLLTFSENKKVFGDKVMFSDLVGESYPH